MKILKGIARICFCVLVLVILVVLGLNAAKFLIYHDYYAIESTLCKNPGINDGFVCQGIAAADDHGLILVSGYMKDKQPSRIYVTTLDSESYYVTLHCDGKPYTGHAGGVAVSGEKVYIASGSRIYTFALEDVMSASNGDAVNIGSGVRVNNKASFLYTDDTYLYVGSFMDDSTQSVEEHVFDTVEGVRRAICSVYAIDDLSAPVRVYAIRDYVQGVCATPDGKLVMSTSHGLTSSAYYVYDLASATDTGKTLDGASVYDPGRVERAVSGPAMAEGLDYFQGTVITLTESASNKYIFGKLFFATDIVALDMGALLW